MQTNKKEKEKIIVDGVDVSGCEFFSSGLGYCTIGLLADDGTHICECEQDCYYKQLKRKENECVNLKYEITCLNNKVQDLDDGLKIVARKLKASEQECECLNVYIESNKEQVEDAEKLVMDNDRLINELMELKKANDEKNEFLEKLGISSMGEFHRIKYYIDNLKKENNELRTNLFDKTGASARAYRLVTYREYNDLLEKFSYIRTERNTLSKLLNEIDEFATDAYCLANGVNKDMADFALQVIRKTVR